MTTSRKPWFFIRKNKPECTPCNAGTTWPVTVFLDNNWYANAHSVEHAHEIISHYEGEYVCSSS